MVQLTDFELHKLYGLIYKLNGFDTLAIKEFLRALIHKQDGHTYYECAFCYGRVGNYKECQKFALLAIENGFDAFRLYVDVTWGNIRNYGECKNYLEKWALKNNWSAFENLAHLERLSDSVNEMEYLEKAFELAPLEEKGRIALVIGTQLLKTADQIRGVVPVQKYEEKGLYYLEQAAKYGDYIKTNRNLKLFNNTCSINSFHIFEKMLRNFDKEARFIFMFHLLKKFNETNPDGNPLDNRILGLLIKLVGYRDKNPIGALYIKYYQNAPKFVLRIAYKKYELESILFPVPKAYFDDFQNFLSKYEELLYDSQTA